MDTTIVNSQKKRIIAIGCTTAARQSFAVVMDTWHNDFEAGRAAFHRRECPQPNWSAAKSAGWNQEGEQAYLACCENDSIGVSETFSPWR